MREIVLALGLVFLALVWAGQRGLVRAQNAAQRRLRTGDDDGIYVFTSATCPVCRSMKQRFAGRREVEQVIWVDVQERREMAERYRIRSVPTTIVLADGQVASATTGFVDLDALLRSMS